MGFEALQQRLLARVNSSVRNGDLTERGFARMIGISQPHMHHILKGARGLSIETADRILLRLGLSVEDLLEQEPAYPSPPRRVRSGVGNRAGLGGLLEYSSEEGWHDPGGKLNKTIPDTSKNLRLF